MVKQNLFFILISLLFFNSSPSFCYNNHGDIIVASVNGISIPQKMLELFILKNRANVLNYFSQKYQITDYHGFWEKSFPDNIVPKEILKKRALEDCMKMIVQQMLAKKNGVIDNISFEAFLNRFNNENEYRKKSIAENKPIYGPVQFSESAYLDHYMSLLAIDLKKKLAEKDFKVSDFKLKEFYERKKNDFYIKISADNKIQFYQFEEYKSLVHSNYIDEQYDNLVSKLMITTKIKINNYVYEKIEIN